MAAENFSLNTSYVNSLVEEANQSGFQQGYQKARRDNSRIIAVDPDRVVQDVAAYRVDGYTISLETGHNNSYLRESEWSGYTWKNGSIVLRSGMSLSWTFETCKHEVKHNVYPDLGHEEMEEKSSDVAERVCLKLVSQFD